MDEQPEQPEPQWLTYGEAAERLNVSPHAVRMRANRYGWRRQIGNDGKARVLIALEPCAPDERPKSTRSSPARKAVEDTLREHNAALDGHIATLKADIERLEAQLRIEADRLAESEAQAEKQAAEAAAQLAAERERADKAIAAFATLADRLDALAAERTKPWWKRLVG